MGINSDENTALTVLVAAGDSSMQDISQDVAVLDTTANTQATRFTYVAPPRKPYPFLIGICRRFLFKSFITFVFLGTAIYLVYDVLTDKGSDAGATRARLVKNIKIFSVPLVSLLFTWFHVWLALQMMFYPIEFYGCPSRPIVPVWLDLPINGWQGIVPRKAGLMAQRCCDKMIGNIVTIEEFANRVHPAHFWDQLQDMFGKICSEVLNKVIVTRWPALWAALPNKVKEELQLKVFEETRNSFLPALVELKVNINSILDIRAMATEALTNDPALMVNIFREVATRELLFITHVAAVMGFILGLVQVGLYLAFQTGGIMDLHFKYTDYVMLPVSGLLIGFGTNWLALKMTFSPIWPHMMCGNYINIQGVFLKRQKEAADQMATAICKKVIDARAMVNYMIKENNSGAGMDKVLEIYRRHIDEAVDKSIGRLSGVCPGFVKEEMERLKTDVVEMSLDMIPTYSKDIERYMDETMDVQQTLSSRLARVTPPEFEDIIHPIFQQDEWILLFVGGFLGVVIGLLQAYALQNIH